MTQGEPQIPDEVIGLPDHPGYALYRYGRFWHLREIDMPNNALSRETWTEAARQVIAAGGYGGEVSHAGLLEGN